MLYNSSITKQTVNQARKALELERGMPVDSLNYMGFTDCTSLAPGWYQLQFNVTIKGTKSPTLVNGTIPYNVGGPNE